MKNKIVLLLIIFILVGCSGEAKENKDVKEKNQISVVVKDLTAPTIQLKQEEVSLIVGDTFSLSDYLIDVYDNYDQKIDYKTKGSVDTTKAGTYSIKITAKDKAGNATNKILSVNVKEKEVTKEENNSNTTNNSDNHSSTQKPSSNTTSNGSLGTTASPSRHPMSGKQYLFSAGYDNISASQACANDLLSVPNAPGSCSGIYDENGNPIGVVLK